MNIILISAVLVYGVITSMSGNTLTLKTCDGDLTVDASVAVENNKTVPLSIGKHVVISGDLQGTTVTAATIANKRLACNVN